ncbi:MAG TPA: hypothetical protein VJN89_12815 [Candidatus Acidoferrum sp.]|nr:hypothetical protein [Candidatus Acidoferrum sp.]
MTTQVPGNAEHQFGEPHVEILSLETPKPEAPSPGTAANSASEPARCQHFYPNGTQCRFRGPDLQSGLCLRHFREKVANVLPPSPSDSEDLSADLLPEPTDFSLGEDVQKFLARLVAQVTKGRISPRRAAVLGYLTNQLLHSHRAIDLDKELESEPQGFIFDLPRPKRD